MVLILRNMVFRQVVVCFFLLLSVQTVVAQVKTQDIVAKSDTAKPVAKPKLSYFKPKLTYLSNSVYSGRKDSAAISYLTPGIEYADKSGFNFSASASYLLSGNVHRFDLFSLGAGYDFNINKNWDVSLSADKDFYNDSSKAIQGGTKGSLGVDMTYDLDIVQIGGGAEMMFEETNQYGGNISIAHSFDFGTEDSASWSITPTLKANYGTQGFLDQNTRRKVKRKNQVANKKNSVVTNIIGGTNAFSILDYECSLPISFSAKNWGISFTPTYSIPLNPTTTITKTTNFQNGIQVGQPVTSVDRENLSNSLYFEVELFWKFDIKNKK